VKVKIMSKETIKTKAPDISALSFAEMQKLVDELHAKANRAPVSGPASVAAPWNIGANYLIRTVTMIDTGRLVDVTATELVIEDAAWIADTGRFSDALEKCTFGEVEPFPAGRVIIGRGSIIDAVEIATIPRIKK
jgi:hypothetical protein